MSLVSSVITYPNKPVSNKRLLCHFTGLCECTGRAVVLPPVLTFALSVVWFYKMLKKNLVKFYVIDKALSGKLICRWYLVSFSGEATLSFSCLSPLSVEINS